MTLDLIAALIQTQALRLAPPGQVFWYTSGTVGPYYINTQYLCGGQAPAEELLRFIDAEKGDRQAFPGRLQERVEAQAAADPVFAREIEALAERARQAGGEQADFVSGGERRDWFFSALVADRLGKPHLLIYKDLSAVLFREGKVAPVAGLEGKRGVHVADLITEASSYVRDWIPAIRQRGGEMACAVNVVDRAQGGAEALHRAGVRAEALLRVDEELFAALRRAGHIDARQEQVLLAYARDPHAAMKAFLQEHPEFLRQALRSADERTAGRARLLAEQNPYQLAPELLQV
jgi:orotate phosphoribosyltransferase